MQPIYNTSKQDNNCYLKAKVEVERTAMKTDARNK